MNKLTVLDTVEDDQFFSLHYYELATVQGFLKALRVPEYFIAGGYFRDKLLGVPYKDIDVFIPGDQSLELLGDEKIRYSLQGAAEFTWGGAKINLIVMEHRHTFETILERMDIGLCQIGLRGRDVVATEAFLRDRENKTLSVLYPITTQGDQDHVNRVSAKYPSYAVLHV